jgi:succinate-semialdehyde dehydrogenase/glutarate-semialdehyde dehydrogenase
MPLATWSDFVRDQCHIDGQWLAADSNETVDVLDPGSGDLIGAVPWMGASETGRAIAAAERALPAWRALTAEVRGRLLRRLYELMLAHRPALAELLTREQGKPLPEAMAEIAYGAAYVEWFAEEGRRAYGEVIPSFAPDRRIICWREPVGVVGAITPWNFPVAMITRKLAPALAAGCTIVVKPADQTPLSALALALLCGEAGIPPGVVNVVTGDPGAVGGALTASRTVRKLSFTGSTEVGRLLMRQSADTIKKLSLELGGNAPFIVFEDADIDEAVEGAIIAKFRNGGQTCVCANRFYVQDGIYDDFVARLAARAAELRVGHGLSEGVSIGPLIDDAAVLKVERHVADALTGGAALLTGGRCDPLGRTYFEPTVLAGVRPDMMLAREETFGPVAGVIRFSEEAEVLRFANASEFGLAAYLYSRDLSRIWRMAEMLEVGMVGVNTGLISTEIAPFGGVKQSGLGREGSRHGIDEYLETKYLCMRVDDVGAK